MATFTVTNTNDSGAGSLRQAVLDANAALGADAIVFDSTLSGSTIVLTTGELEITDALDINGLGADQLAVSAGGNSRVFSVFDGIRLNVPISVSLSELTITGGSTSDLGGGIYNRESLSISNSTVSGNSAGGGGGIADYGSFLSISNSTVSGNSAGLGGGGIVRNEVTIIDSTISGNTAVRGGGIEGGFQMTIANSTISDNSADLYSGGLYVGSGNTVTINNSTISDNSAGLGGGGIEVRYGVLTLLGSTVSGNTADRNGGGLGGYYGDLTISNSTVIDNSANGSGGGLGLRSSILTMSASTVADNSANRRGGGIYSDGSFSTLTVANSTIGGNTVDKYDGGGIYIEFATLNLSNSTIASNSASRYGGGIYNGSSELVALALVSTIVADNLSSGNNPDLSNRGEGTIEASFSLIENGLVTDDLGNNIFGQDPLLGPLQNNGGLTPTQALLPGSPAFDAGSNPDNLLSDQRGGGFAREFNGRADIGAFELQEVFNRPPIAAIDLASTDEDTAFAFSGNVLANDTDADSDALTVTELDGDAASIGTEIALPSGALVTLNADGSFDYNPNGAFESLAVGESTTDTFNYTVSDGDLTDQATVEIAIAGVNDRPSATNDRPAPGTVNAVPGVFATLNEPTTIQVLANDSDPDGDDLTLSLVSQPNNGTAAIDDNGTSANPNDDAIVYTPNDGFIGQDRFQYQIDDGNGGTDTATVVVAVSAPVIAEMGRIEGLTDTPQTIDLRHNFVDPVVIAQPLSRNNGQTAIARLQALNFNGNTDSFTIAIQETSNLDGAHLPEDVSYLVVEKGTWELDSGSLLEVGSVDISGEAIAGFDTVNFAAPFAEAPAVFSQVQTNNDTDFVRTRQQNATATSFQVAMEEEEALAGISDRVTETVGYLAIASGAGTWDGRPYFATTTGDVLTTEQAERIGFEGTFVDDPNNPPAPPQLFASLNSYNDPDPAGLRAQKVSPWQVDLRLEEDTSSDPETAHAPESASILAIQGANPLLEAIPALAAPEPVL